MNFRKTKIDWCSHTWNPVSGCLHGCDYCYARRIAERFGPHATERPMGTGIQVDPDAEGCYVVNEPVKLADHTGKYSRSTPYPKVFAPTLHAHNLDFPVKNLTPSRVFVCNMADLFGEWVPDKWIEAVFDACKRADQHIYMFLTKNPQRYIDLANAGKLPAQDNFWYGTTITNGSTDFFFSHDHKTFLSIEPLLEDFPDFFNYTLTTMDWVIVGAMTGPGSGKRQPKKEWVEKIVDSCRVAGVPVFLKDNLAGIWKGPLIRELPQIMADHAKGVSKNGKG